MSDEQAEREAERLVSELLPQCSLRYLGLLKVRVIGDVQREKLARHATGSPEPDASRVAGRPAG